MKKPVLSIGMSTYDDYDGVFFTIQSLRMFHDICNTPAVEFIVMDNNPNGKHAHDTKMFVTNSVKGKYIEYDNNSSSFNKYKTVDYASGQNFLGIDCHVLIEKNGIDHLLSHFERNPNCMDIIQGPLWYDGLDDYATHFDPVWRGDMYGIWAKNQEAYEKGEPFEIEMQGMGLYTFRREAWKGINRHFRGFGAEEGYIQGKFRQWGGKAVCLPQLKWNHRFGRPNGVPYSLKLEDRIWNYFLGAMELYQDENHPFILSIFEHFADKVPEKLMKNYLTLAKENV